MPVLPPASPPPRPPLPGWQGQTKSRVTAGGSEEDNTGFPEARLESPKHKEVEGAHAHTLV